MKLANYLRALLTVAFVVGVLSSTHAGQKGVVVSPDAGTAEVQPDASKVAPAKVVPGKEDQKALPGKDTRSRSPVKIQQKPAKLMKATIMCQGKPATIVAKSQTGGSLNGTMGSDVIVGLGGIDIIDGKGGDDIICGGGGNDIITGGSGNDKIEGGLGDDTIYGLAGNDILKGGPGMDHLYGGTGNDELYGGNDNDILDGESGNDILNGGSGKDSCLNPGNYFNKTTNCENFKMGKSTGQKFKGKEEKADSATLKKEGGFVPKSKTEKVIPREPTQKANPEKDSGGSQVVPPKMEAGKDSGGAHVVPPKMEVGKDEKNYPQVFPLIEGVFAAPNPEGEGGMSRVSPGGYLYIKGLGFGTQNGIIFLGKIFLYGMGFPDGKLALNPALWESDSRVNGRVPLVTGIKDQVVEVVVVTKEGFVSNRHKHMFLGIRETRVLGPQDPAVNITQCGLDANNNSCGCYEYWTGYKGTLCGAHSNYILATEDDEDWDHFRIELKNGWKIVHGEFIQKDLTSDNEKVGDPTPDWEPWMTSWKPTFHWVVSPNDMVRYIYQVTIEGPKGVPHY